MKKFDTYLRHKISKEQREVSNLVKDKIEETLQTLPQTTPNEKKSLHLPRFAFAAGCLVFVMVFLLPNVSVVYADTMEKVPFIGDIIHVVTIRNYFYSDDKHEMDIKVPKVEHENSSALDSINEEITELTDTVLKRFYADLEQIKDKGHSSVYVDYNVVTNTDFWFTLKIQVVEAAGSGNTYYEYYHLDKRADKIIKLGDIVEKEAFYEVVEKDIEKQMLQKMKEDKNLVYWVKDATFGDCVSIDSKHNFYWDKEGNFVVPFDKYKVSPGYMGTPEFCVKKDIIKKYLKDEFKDMF